ncbi:hypothetical protein EVAR_17434_1 [Eumeta japonica]|uniref:Uncharacterized protein n=1 Tax=Eumeta variegata TaxID=151549 RepID=A0A4C1VB65_EUMVA|nr:hypothetical protein EVAR_17434_1 [Eumeta japonica]
MIPIALLILDFILSRLKLHVPLSTQAESLVIPSWTVRYRVRMLRHTESGSWDTQNFDLMLNNDIGISGPPSGRGPGIVPECSQERDKTAERTEL